MRRYGVVSAALFVVVVCALVGGLLGRHTLATAERVLGSKTALVEEKPEMGGEDFSYYGAIAPAVMLNLGVIPPDRDTTAVHSPTFVADEASIPIGVNLMANIILDHLAQAAKTKPAK